MNDRKDSIVARLEAELSQSNKKYDELSELHRGTEHAYRELYHNYNRLKSNSSHLTTLLLQAKQDYSQLQERFTSASETLTLVKKELEQSQRDLASLVVSLYEELVIAPPAEEEPAAAAPFSKDLVN